MSLQSELRSGTRPWSGALWYALAALAVFFPLLLNGGPLFYFDTASYIGQGIDALKILGISIPSPGGGAGAGDIPGQDGTVTGSRSIVYSMFAGFARLYTGMTSLAVLQGCAFLLTVWIAVRAALRAAGDTLARTASHTALVTLAAALGTMPFVAVYLMPDIFAPIMILGLGTLAALTPVMRLWEILVLLALTILAIVTHPSHLFIAILMVPLAGLIALLLRQRRWWLAPLMVALVAGAGMAERLAFTAAVKTVRTDAQVVYQPFLTVRAIVDGPGYQYLADHCPDENLATCRLYDELQVSDDPYRMTASHIMFETSRRLGSFQFLSDTEQAAIAAEQISFFLNVVLERPFGVGLALMGNTLDQMNKHNLSLIVPTHRIFEQARNISAYVPDSFSQARFLDHRDWIGPLTWAQRALYAAAALLIVALMIRPSARAPAPVRVLALMLLAGIAVNAFVCGGVSQPSDRYGARVIFLLPMAAAFLLLFRARD